MLRDSIRSNIELQLTELEILQSIYSNNDEFTNEDTEAFAAAQAFISNQNESFSKTISFIIKTVAEYEDNECKSTFVKLPLQIVCRLPVTYPLIEPPNVFVRSNDQSLSRKFTEDLSTYIAQSHSNESSILDIIEWIKDNVGKYLVTKGASAQRSVIAYLQPFFLLQLLLQLL